MLKDLITANRSIRRFQQNVVVKEETLRELVDLARLSPSGNNRQPLKYILSCEPGKNSLIFGCLGWAASLKDWPGPADGERPAAYIIILGDTEITANFSVNHGIAAHSMLLGATEKGLGGCMLGSVKREKLREVLAIPEKYEILLVVAIGKPKEKVVLEDMEAGGDPTYWRDKAQVHHVPKRRLKDIII